MALTDTTFRNARTREKPYKLSDGKGLYLLVKPSGTKLWCLKYRVNDTERKLSFGTYPEVTLAKAREKQLDARRLLDGGIDPGVHKKQLKRAAIISSANSFEAVAREWFLKFSPGWAAVHSCKVLLRIENDLFPWLGARPIEAIEADELLVSIRRIEARGALETAHRCLGYCAQIFRYAIATARAKRNPAADLRGSLPPSKPRHFASITSPERVGELMRAIEGYQGNFRTRCALKLAAMTFVRPGELRHAEWAHFNFDAAEWRIPAEQMKTREGLTVPLSRQALALVHELQPLTGAGRYLFHCERTTRRPMSENTVTAALRRLGYTSEEMTGHGFRAMARTILDEVLEYRVEWIEHQLAHEVKDSNGRAYNRTSFLAGRRGMMQGWSDYLDERRADTNVRSEASNPTSKAA